MDSKEYVNLLEAAVSSHPNAPCENIVNWKGPGDLKTHEDLDDLVDKITKDEKDTKAAVQEDVEGEPSDNDKDSPLSILESELDKTEEDTETTDDIVSETVKFTDQESEILNRLITEMDALDAEDLGDDLLDTVPEAPPEPESIDVEDLELGVPQEDYELEDLGV